MKKRQKKPDQGIVLDIKPRNINQKLYIDTIKNHDITFGLGPAGTGKTFLAVSQAVYALLYKQVDRIIIARPAIEAGEKLGYLPGDMYEKIDPYMAPIYDALYDMLPSGKVDKLLDDNVVEVVPLAYMRGRTLNDAFIILDEAQNTTRSQMKMFLTRLGPNSKMVINGDETQIDLPNKSDSGLTHAFNLIKGVDGIGHVVFNDSDVVRHKLVSAIINAYQ